MLVHTTVPPLAGTMLSGSASGGVDLHEQVKACRVQLQLSTNGMHTMSPDSMACTQAATHAC